MMKTKQVIVMIKRFPKNDQTFFSLRKGKMVAQGCHASSSHFVKIVDKMLNSNLVFRFIFAISFLLAPKRAVSILNPKLNINEAAHWMSHQNPKIVVQVDDEKQLLEIVSRAESNGLTVSMIQDAGLTEFDGPTITCACIGPNSSEKIDKITQHLMLL